MNLKIYFDRDLASDSVRMYLIGEDAHGKKSIAKQMELVFIELNRDLINPPTLEIRGHEADQFLPALANALAQAGYRHESTDAGELKATKYHLEDMRKLVLKT